MARISERDFMLELIKLYRQYPELWQIKSKDYHDRNKKNAAYDVLIEKYKEFDANATKDVVKRKLNSLRTNYRKELKKVQLSYESINSSDRIYKSTLWYYKELSFLQDQELAAKTKSTCGEDEHDLTVKDEEEDIDTETKFANDARVTLPSKTLVAKKSLACNHSDNSEEYECIAKAWACELRKMRPDQQIYAKKAINDIIFEGQLGNLRRNSVTVNVETGNWYRNPEDQQT